MTQGALLQQLSNNNNKFENLMIMQEEDQPIYLQVDSGLDQMEVILDPLKKINILKQSTGADIKVGSNVKYFILDLRADKKLKLQSVITKHKVYEIDLKTSREQLAQFLNNPIIKKCHIVLAISLASDSNRKESRKAKNERHLLRRMQEMLKDKSYVSVLDCGIKD